MAVYSLYIKKGEVLLKWICTIDNTFLHVAALAHLIFQCPNITADVQRTVDLLTPHPVQARDCNSVACFNDSVSTSLL